MIIRQYEDGECVGFVEVPDREVEVPEPVVEAPVEEIPDATE